MPHQTPGFPADAETNKPTCMKKLLYLFCLLWSCAYLLPLSAKADSTCTAAFTQSISGHTVNFKSIPGLAPGTTHWWTFGDATNSTGANPVHTYSATGTYWVTHYILNQATNCRDSFVRAITIDTASPCSIQPKFVWYKDSMNCLKVRFINQSVPLSSDIHFVWKFGDGTGSTEANPSHIYQQEGVYNVCLVMETSNGCRREFCMQVEVRCQPQPPACNVQSKFVWRRDSTQWNKIWFANLSQPVQNIWRTSWTYGDGTSSQDFNSVHVYQQPGRYYVCLKVQSLNGCITTYCDTVIVRRDSCENRSDFRFEANPNNLLEYRFKPKYPSSNFRYFWSFGDGSSSTEMFPVHRYASRGSYKVCLTVITSNTCRTTTCYEVRVGQNCNDVRVKFEYRRDSLKPYIVKFQAVSNVPILQQQWVIQKLTPQVFPPSLPVVINGNNPTYTFRDSGWYVVCLNAVTADSCRKTYCEKIYIQRGENGRLVTTSFIPVFPNPARNLVRLDVPVEVSTTLKLRVLDGAGVPKMEFSTPARAGNNLVIIPVEKLSNGLYVVEIRYGNQLKLAKFQKS